jgi:acyl carrier protein
LFYRNIHQGKQRKRKEKEYKAMALTQDEVLAGIRDIVVEVAGIDGGLVSLEKKFADDLDVDSLSMVEVIVAAEEKFSVKIPDDEVTKMATVADAVNFIVAHS